MTNTLDRMLDGLPRKAQNTIHATMSNIALMTSIENPKVAVSMAPSAMRGFVLGENDRVRRSGESYVKDFQPLRLGVITQPIVPRPQPMFSRSCDTEFCAFTTVFVCRQSVVYGTRNCFPE